MPVQKNEEDDPWLKKVGLEIENIVNLEILVHV